MQNKRIVLIRKLEDARCVPHFLVSQNNTECGRFSEVSVDSWPGFYVNTLLPCGRNSKQAAVASPSSQGAASFQCRVSLFAVSATGLRPVGAKRRAVSKGNQEKWSILGPCPKIRKMQPTPCILLK